MTTNLTNGWDTIVAIHTDSLNIGLEKAYNADLLPHGLQKEFQFVLFGTPLLNCTLKCDMDAWQISGGTGEDVTINIPLTKGSLELAPVSDNDSKPSEFPIENWILAVTVNLSRIDNHVEGSKTGEIKSDIIIDFQENTFVSLRLEADDLSTSDKDSIETILTKSFKKFMTKQSYPLVTVDLNYLEENYPYIVPKTFKYGIEYHKNSDDKDIGTFAIMMQTISPHQGSSSLEYGVVPNLLPYCNSSAILSNEIFMKQIALPQLKNILGVEPSSDLLVVKPAGQEEIFKIISTDSLETKIDKYDVKLSSVMATLNNGIIIEATGSTKLLGIFIIHFDAKFVSDLSFNPDSQVLNFEINQGRSYFDTRVSLVWWIKLIELLIVAFAFAFVGTVAGFTYLFTFLLLNTLIETVVNNLAKKVVKKSLPNVIPAHVNWKYEEQLNIEQINLSTPLQVGTFAPSLEPKAEKQTAVLLDNQSAYNNNAAMNTETFIRYDDRVELILNKDQFNEMFATSAPTKAAEEELENQTVTVCIERFSKLAESSNWTEEQITAAQSLLDPIEDYLFDHVFTGQDKTLAFMKDPLEALSQLDMELDESKLQDFAAILEPIFEKNS